MPLYEYKCDKCGHRFEKIEKHSASEIKKCPKCGANAPRQISAAGIQFKGSGWYVTDYAGKGSSPSSSEGDGASSKSDKSGKIREGREIGDKIERDQIVREILERKILVKEGQKVTSLDALAQSKFQSLQIRSKLIPELRILQRDLHRRFQKSQLIASVMRLTVVDPRV